MKLRTLERQCLYDSDWDTLSVIGRCEQKGIPAMKVARAIRLFTKFKIPVKRFGGALTIVFRLLENN